MSRRPPEGEDPAAARTAALAAITALGVAAWAVCVELTATLEEKKLLSSKRCRQVFASAARGLQALNDEEPHPILELAVAIVRGQVENWDDFIQ